MRESSPNWVLQAKIQESSVWAGTWLCTNRTCSLGSMPTASSSAASSRVWRRSAAGFLAHGQRVQVGDHVQAVVAVLQKRPVAQRAEIIAQRGRAGGLDGRDRMRLRAGVGVRLCFGHGMSPFCVVQGENKTPLHRKALCKGRKSCGATLLAAPGYSPGERPLCGLRAAPGPVTGGQPAADTGPNAVPRALRDPLCPRRLPPRSQLRGLSVGAARGFTFASTVSEKIIALPRRLVKRAGGALFRLFLQLADEVPQLVDGSDIGQARLVDLDAGGLAQLPGQFDKVLMVGAQLLERCAALQVLRVAAETVRPRSPAILRVSCCAPPGPSQSFLAL